MSRDDLPRAVFILSAALYIGLVSYGAGVSAQWYDKENLVGDNEGGIWRLNTTPEQIHIALGNNISEMVIVWASPDPLQPDARPSVSFGEDARHLDKAEFGRTVEFNVPAGYWGSKFIEGNYLSAHGHYRVVLHGLKPDTKYWYTVKSGDRESTLRCFTTLPAGRDWLSRFIVYGDMGRRTGAESLGRLRLEAEEEDSRVHAYFHIGDFAYNFQDDGGKNGDLFMERIEGIASHIPYMTCPGNHEIFSDFAHYRNRFSMPFTDWPMPIDKLWYSVDIGMVHFVSYSTEVYFTNEKQYVPTQLEWLKNDLELANRPANRSVRPWIIAFGHRPMYCSNTDRDDCTKNESLVRRSLEDIMYKYGVDLILQGHEHSYERLYPVYNGSITNCDYVNPRAPVHLIAGAAGCNEDKGLCVDVILKPAGPWSAYRSWLPGLHGYGRLQVHNATHLHWEQVIAYTGQTMDSFWLVQERHAPFSVPFMSDRSSCDV